MNRGTVVFLALAILLAHTLAIHQTPAGDFAPPYEIAHVAFRLGRNLIYEGAAAWNPDGSWIDSYPSPFWVLLSALAARTYLSPTIVCQWFGIFCSLATVVVLAQFSVARMAGLIAPMLLAACGAAAAAGASGTEAPLAMLLATGAFLAFERGWPRALAMSLTALVLVRPEALALLAVLFLLELVGRPSTLYARRLSMRRSYLLPFAIVVIFPLLHRLAGGSWISPFTAHLLDWDLARLRLGTEYLWTFLYASGYGLLVLTLVVSLAFGRASPMALRATVLAVAWFAVVALSGADGLPFWNALAPVLPLLFLAIQECLREWMDDHPVLAWAVWPLLVVSVLASFMASKVPGDLGPFPLEGSLMAWMRPTEALERDFGRPLGRVGLMDEVRSVEHLRPLGVFLRDKVSPDASILTFWPGAIGYLSRKEVFDVLGRVWPPPGKERTLSWRGVPKVDVVEAISRQADYLVPVIGSLSEGKVPSDFLRTWLERYDVVGPSETRLRELVNAISGYELVCVPVPEADDRPREMSERPFPLLRRHDLKLTPKLEIELDGRRFRVYVRHEGHQQVVDLMVSATGVDGSSWNLNPIGEWVSESRTDARTKVLLHPTGLAPIRMIEAELPSDPLPVEIVAQLHNPGVRPDTLLSEIGAPYVLKLPPQ